MRGFRNLADADLELPAAGCVITGPNGHGKTSFIEALLYARVFRSFRGSADRELVRFGAEGFWLEVESGAQADAGARARTRRIGVGYDSRTRQKRVRLDGAVPARLADAIGIIRGVVLSPADVVLVCGGPRERRRYLDVVLALSERGYVEMLGRYRKALAQRMRAGAADLGAWEAVLAESGAAIVSARRSWVERWRVRYAEHCSAIGETGGRHDGRAAGGPDMVYRTSAAGGAEELREALAASRERDRELGRTTVGPHMDELRLLLDGRDVRTYGSAGQQRTAALALRMLEAETLRERGGPLLLALDDAFAELDDDRSRRLGELIESFARGGTQIVAAVPKREEVPAVVQSLERWEIDWGHVSRSG